MTYLRPNIKGISQNYSKKTCLTCKKGEMEKNALKVNTMADK